MDVREKIEAFFNAGLSFEEEMELYRYLCENEVPDDLQSAKKAIIALCGYDEDFSMPEDVEMRLEAFIDALADEEKREGTSVVAVEKAPRKIIKIPMRVWRTLSAAAVLVFAFVITYNKIYDTAPYVGQSSAPAQIAQAEEPEEDTFSTPEEALPFVAKTLKNAYIAMAEVQDEVENLNNELVCMTEKFSVIKKVK